jgi:hypothetical protein
MDIESQKHEMIAKQLTKRYQASQALSSHPGSGPGGSRFGGTIKRTNTLSRRSGSNIDGDAENKSLNPLDRSGSAQSSFVKEGGDKDDMEAAEINEADQMDKAAEDFDKLDQDEANEGLPNDGELIKGTKLPDKDKEGPM